MADVMHTFGRDAKPLTFAEAINFHEMMKAPTKDYLAKRKTKRALDRVELSELWDGLSKPQTELDEDNLKTCMAMAVSLTIPSEYVPIVRRADGVATAFAYCEILKGLITLDAKGLKDDYAVRQVMTAAWERFTERVQAANEVQEGFGCDSSQSWHTLRDIAKEPDSQHLLEKMRAIARLAGLMYQSFNYHRKMMPNDDPQEVRGATMGGDLSRVSSTELALLADEELADMQAMKFFQKKAVIQDMEGVEEVSRGPMVLVCDESGSMNDDGTWGYSGKRFAGRNTWAKACMVALTRIAWQENRPVAAVHFGTATVVQAVPKDDTRAMFEMARSFLSGGTCFGAALKRARKLIGDNADYKGADIVLITDGEDPDHTFHNREIDHMDAVEIQLWTVAIGFEIDDESPVRKRAKRYTYAHDRQLSRPETATMLARGLDKAAMGNKPGQGLPN